MPTMNVAAAIILQAQQVLIAKRPADKHKGGLWEFPGGKIEPGESAEQALAREIKEELDIDIQSFEHFTEILFEYPEKKVKLIFYIVESFYGTPQGMEGQPVRWVALKDLNDFDFPEANQAVVTKLLDERPV